MNQKVLFSLEEDIGTVEESGSENCRRPHVPGETAGKSDRDYVIQSCEFRE